MQNNIKIERAKKNITQSELAKVIDVSRLTVHSIEVKKFNPSVIIALKMARYFNINVEELFMLEDTD